MNNSDGEKENDFKSIFRENKEQNQIIENTSLNTIDHSLLIVNEISSLDNIDDKDNLQRRIIIGQDEISGPNITPIHIPRTGSREKKKRKGSLSKSNSNETISGNVVEKDSKDKDKEEESVKKLKDSTSPRKNKQISNPSSPRSIRLLHLLLLSFILY
jgi:hypothetical protein